MPSITKSSKRTSTTIDQRARRERGRRASGERTPEERAAAAAERAAKRRPPKQRPRLRDRREAGKHAEGRRRTKLATLNRSERRPETDAPAHSPALVSFDNVFKEYAPGVGLNGASFDIAPGEFVFLVGATGSGKSTIMRLLTKELEPSGGRIEVAGRDLSHIPRKRVPHYRRNIGVIFQDFKLLPTRTVYENVAYALRATGHSRREIRAKVPDILRLTGLSTKLHNYPDELSGGEQQRVSIARAFVNHPPLLLADEPTGNLDPETSIGIMQLLYRINRTGTTVLVATHDREMVDRMRRRVIELAKGKVVRDERAGGYARRETTREFTVRLREGMQGAGKGRPVGSNGKPAAPNGKPAPAGSPRAAARPAPARSVRRPVAPNGAARPATEPTPARETKPQD